MILDTNGLSGLADGDPELERVVLRAALVAIPVIVLGEFRYGINLSRNRAAYQRWLSQTVVNCQILRIDEATAEEYASIRAELRRLGRPIPSNDVWIAALAMQHDLPVVSRDHHFDVVPNLRRIAW